MNKFALYSLLLCALSLTAAQKEDAPKAKEKPREKFELQPYYYRGKEHMTPHSFSTDCQKGEWCFIGIGKANEEADKFKTPKFLKSLGIGYWGTLFFFAAFFNGNQEDDTLLLSQRKYSICDWRGRYVDSIINGEPFIMQVKGGKFKKASFFYDEQRRKIVIEAVAKLADHYEKVSAQIPALENLDQYKAQLPPVVTVLKRYTIKKEII